MKGGPWSDEDYWEEETGVLYPLSNCLGNEGETAVVKAMPKVLPASTSDLSVSCSNSSSHYFCYKRGTAVVKAMLQLLPVSASHVSMSSASRDKLGTFIGCAIGRRIDRRSRKFPISAEQSDNQFEIDRAKAKEALKDLDQQLLISSQKKIPKTRFLSSVEADIKKREPITAGLDAEDVPDVSGLYLAYIATFLVIITILNNVAFNMFVKPSVDNKGPPPASAGARLFQEEIRQAPPL